MITVSKAEAKMIRKNFPRVHMTKTVNHLMVDEIPAVLQALPNNVDAQAVLVEMERDARRREISNTLDEVRA